MQNKTIDQRIKAEKHICFLVKFGGIFELTILLIFVIPFNTGIDI